MTLTVIIADHSRFVCLQEPVQHRTVHLRLTPEQEYMLRMRDTHTSGGTQFKEEIAMCYIEEDDK